MAIDAEFADIDFCGCEQEPHTCVDQVEVEADERTARLRSENARLQVEVSRLTALINMPRTDDFFEAVRIEAAHQIERWGVDHDAGKRPEDWCTLLLYLLGKAAKAHFDGDNDKLLHHVITVAAVALNWHRNATGVNTRMRPGVGPRCACSHEAGDSECAVHPTCAGCGDRVAKLGDVCSNCHGKGFA